VEASGTRARIGSHQSQGLAYFIGDEKFHQTVVLRAQSV